MPKPLHERLRAKGWSEEDIEYTVNTLYSPEHEEKHGKLHHSMKPAIYWGALILSIFGNIVISALFIPFLMFLNSIPVYIILGTIGAMFGAMFNLLLKDIEHVDYQHHVYAGAVIPAIALVNVTVVVTLSNMFNKAIENPIDHNPLIIAVVYVLAFSSPYMIYKYKDMKEQKVREVQPEAPSA